MTTGSSNIKDRPQGSEPGCSGIHLGGTARTPEDVAAIHELGLHFAEIPISDPQRFESAKEAFTAAKKKLGLYYLCHGPREGDPNDKTSLEKRYWPKLLRILSIMPELGMNLLSIHLWLDSRYVREDTIAFKVGLLERLVAEADRVDVMVCLENLSERPKDMGRALKAVPSLNLTLDLGHAQLLSKTNTSYGYLDQHASRIKHVHLHDNRGGSSAQDDLHLPVGEGIIAFEKIFGQLKTIGYDRTITLELKPPEIKKCLSRVRELLGMK